MCALIESGAAAADYTYEAGKSGTVGQQARRLDELRAERERAEREASEREPDRRLERPAKHRLREGNPRLQGKGRRVAPCGRATISQPSQIDNSRENRSCIDKVDRENRVRPEADDNTRPTCATV